MASIASGTLPASRCCTQHIETEIAGGDCGDVLSVAWRARRDADEQPAFTGGRAVVGAMLGVALFVWRGWPADCCRTGFAVYREVVVRLAIPYGRASVQSFR